MRIGTIGAGMVGGTLGKAWAQRGHQVMFGLREGSRRDISDLLAEAGENARRGTVREAAAFGDVVVLATPWEATHEALRSAGDLAGKVLLDCTVPLAREGARMALQRLPTSGGEQVAEWAPGASVVKIFCHVGYNVMRDPRFGDQAATIFYCGDDAKAKAVAAQLAAELGFDPVGVGPLALASVLEAQGLLWVQLAIVQGLGREVAFRLLRR